MRNLKDCPTPHETLPTLQIIQAASPRCLPHKRLHWAGALVLSCTALQQALSLPSAAELSGVAMATANALTASFAQTEQAYGIGWLAVWLAS